jgi:hypothetical protein
MYLNGLVAEAKNGSIKDLRELAFMAIEATIRLNDLAESSPDYITNMAESMSFWPVIITQMSNQGVQNRALLKKIQLDSARVSAVPKNDLNAQSVGVKKWALKLFQALEFSRFPKGLHSNTGEWGIRRLPHEHLKPILELLKDDQNSILKAAKALPLLSETSIPEWRKLARKLFLLLTDNKPWEISELKIHSELGRARGLAPDQRADGVKRSDTTKAVMSAFQTLCKQACKIDS